jgi:hypothetical protein
MYGQAMMVDQRKHGEQLMGIQQEYWTTLLGFGILVWHHTSFVEGINNSIRLGNPLGKMRWLHVLHDV